MSQLNAAEEEALSNWLDFALKNLKCDQQAKLLIKYIHALIELGYPPEKFKASLRDFIGDKTDAFVDELIRRLKTKNFSFKKEQSPQPTLKFFPKQQESTVKPQAYPPSPKQNIFETKQSPNITKQKPEPSEKQVRKEEVASKPPQTRIQQSQQESPQKPSQSQQKQSQPQENIQNQKSTDASISDEGDIIDNGISNISIKKMKKKTNEIQQGQFLPNPNAQFSQSNHRNSSKIKRNRLQNLIKSAILASLEKVSPDQTDKISEKLALAIEKKAQQTAEELFVNTTDYDQIRIQNMNQKIQMQYDQYMQNGYLREMQYNMMLQTNAALMKHDDQDEEEEEEEEEAND